MICIDSASANSISYLFIIKYVLSPFFEVPKRIIDLLIIFSYLIWLHTFNVTINNPMLLVPLYSSL